VEEKDRKRYAKNKKMLVDVLENELISCMDSKANHAVDLSAVGLINKEGEDNEIVKYLRSLRFHRKMELLFLIAMHSKSK